MALLDVAAAAGQKSDGVELLALRRIFSTLGVRAEVLTAAGPLDGYSVVFTAGTLLNAGAASGLSNALYDYVEAGGVLVYAGEAGSAMYPLFGVASRAAGRSRLRLAFSGQDPALALLAHPRLLEISLGNGQPPFFKEVIWTHGASLAAGATALGLFEDGSVGFSVHPYGRGRAYLLGVSYTESVLLPQVGGSYNAERQYVNGIEPSADAILLLLKAIWAHAAGPAVCLATAPYALPTALILTHDVDAQTSFVDSLKFAALEKKYGVRSTFFVNTKYFTDENDIDYFNLPENLEAVRQLGRLGWDVGSHTVAHSRKLASAPEGQPTVTRKGYDPLRGLTVWGEVKVSKELLDAELGGRAAIAYRSGDLAFPRSLIRVLQAAGYLYDSTYSANAALSAFPFLAFEEQRVGARESTVVEIPVTLDDSQGFLTAASLAGRGAEVDGSAAGQRPVRRDHGPADPSLRHADAGLQAAGPGKPDEGGGRAGSLDGGPLHLRRVLGAARGAGVFHRPRGGRGAADPGRDPGGGPGPGAGFRGGRIHGNHHGSSTARAKRWISPRRPGTAGCTWPGRAAAGRWSMNNRLAVAAAFLLMAGSYLAAQDQISVASSGELVQALVSNRTILLAPGQYLVSEAAQIGNPAVSWEETFDGPELVITGLSNLTLRAQRGATLLASPRYAFVLVFVGCRNLVLEGLTLGHTEQGECVGGVLRLDACGRVRIQSCDLFGSGVVGLDAADSTGITIRASTIRDCSDGALWATRVRDLRLEDTLIAATAPIR